MSEAPDRLRDVRIFVSPQFRTQMQELGLDAADKATVGGALTRIAAEEFHPMMRPHIVPANGVEPYVVQAHVETQGSGDLLIEAVKLTDAPMLLNHIQVTPAANAP